MSVPLIKNECLPGAAYELCKGCSASVGHPGRSLDPQGFLVLECCRRPQYAAFYIDLYNESIKRRPERAERLGKPGPRGLATARGPGPRQARRGPPPARPPRPRLPGSAAGTVRIGENEAGSRGAYYLHRLRVNVSSIQVPQRFYGGLEVESKGGRERGRPRAPRAPLPRSPPPPHPVQPSG